MFDINIIYGVWVFIHQKLSWPGTFTNIPYAIVVYYGLFTAFQFYQKKWLLEFGGSSPSVYRLINFYVIIFRFLGIGYLIIYAIDEINSLGTWWYGIVSALALYIISWFVSLAVIMVESILPFDNLYKVGMLGFLGFFFLPILLILLIFDTITVLWLFR